MSLAFVPTEATLRAEAYALYLGLLEDLGGDPATFARLDVRVVRDGAPAEDVPVELDHRWTLDSAADGVARFDGLPPRAVLTVRAGDASARVTLPAPKGITLTLPAGH
jgi:hypothetical protein